MTKRIISHIILLVTLISSCQTYDALILQEDKTPSTVVSSNDISFDETINTPIIFLPDTNFKAWSEIVSLEDRIKACNPPQDLLDLMSTEALTKTVSKYPLNYLIFAYDNPFDAIQIVAESSLIHRELESREDASGQLLSLYSSFHSIEMMPNTAIKEDYSSLSFADAMFLDYYVASGRIVLAKTADQREELSAVVRDKIEDRISKPKIFSYASLAPLYRILDDLSSISQDNTKDFSTGATTTHTPFGRRITAIRSTEFTEYEIDVITQTFSQQYPQATLLASASNLYNCHSYAWHEQSTANDLWINQNDSYNSFQLSRYWTSDYFISCSSQQAEKAFYGTAADHSAVVQQNGTFVSKWGAGPLFLHEPSYCPYASSNITYYKPRTTLPFQIESLITGEYLVQTGQTECYHRGFLTNSDASYTWCVESYPNNSNTEEPYINSPDNANWANITFFGEGSYIVRLEISYSNTLFAFDEMNVIVLDSFQ